MKKNIFLAFKILLVILVPLVFSGCQLAGKLDGGIYKSADGGKTFEHKVKIDEKKNIAGEDILVIEIDPNNPNTVYVGSRLGIFRSTDRGETWAQDTNNFTGVTGIFIDPSSSDKITITAQKGGRGKVVRTEDGGENWKDLYTENASGPSVVGMAVDEKNTNVIYIGTSTGGIFKTEDGGQTWRTLLWADSTVRKIMIDNVNSNVVYFGTASSGLLVSKDGGTNFETVVEGGYIYNIIPHPNREGTIYISNKDGLQRSTNSGADWEVLNTLVKPDKLVSRGLEINSQNPRQIYYASSQALYRSDDEGVTWTPIQFDISRNIEVIRVDSQEPNIIYIGTYKRGGGFTLLPS